MEHLPERGGYDVKVEIIRRRGGTEKEMRKWAGIGNQTGNTATALH